MANILLGLLCFALVCIVVLAFFFKKPLSDPELMNELLDADRAMKRKYGDGRAIEEDHAMDIGLPEDYKTPGLYPPGLNDKAEASEIHWETLRGEAHPIHEKLEQADKLIEGKSGFSDDSA